MDDTKTNVFLPYWITEKPGWRLEVWSDDDRAHVSLHLRSLGQWRKRYGDFLPRAIARELLSDLRAVQRCLAWSSRVHLLGILPRWRRRTAVFRKRPEYTLMLWDRRDDLYGSVTLHPALVQNRFILRLTRKEAVQFTDDLSAAVAIAERIEKEGMP